MKLHNNSLLLEVCLNNVNRPTLIITITVLKKRILKRMFEQNRRKTLYITTLYITGKVFVYYEIVR